jgi:hypothetical protein
MKKAAIATFPREALIAKFFGEVSIVKMFSVLARGFS